MFRVRPPVGLGQVSVYFTSLILTRVWAICRSCATRRAIYREEPTPGTALCMYRPYTRSHGKRVTSHYPAEAPDMRDAAVAAGYRMSQSRDF